MKLISEVSSVLSNRVVVLERELPRTIKAAKRKLEKAARRKDLILAIYEHGKPIPQGTKFSEVCRMLQKQFEESRGVKESPWGAIPEEMKKPSRDRIKYWFEKEGILSRDFEKRGHYWIKHY